MLCAVAAASACHRDDGTAPAPKPVPRINIPVVAKGPSAEELTAGMVEASSQGKSQLPVQLKFDLEERPMLGQALVINIAVLPQIDASPADISVLGGDGFTVAPGANKIEIPAVETGQVYRQSVTVTPTVDGVLVVNLSVSLRHDDLAESRTFSIPLIVGR